MCGIAGFLNLPIDQTQAEQLIGQMCQVLRHRGPDAQGSWIHDGVGLGMRRLAIIDRPSGSQPLSNEDGSIWLVFNGEIYNYRALREQLQACGHRFSTQSDTETIVHAYEQYGDDCLSYLRGMFAFALWDHRRHRLLLARDRFGKKPLFYFWDGHSLLFASEIKAILQTCIPRRLNHQALDEFLLYGYVPTPLTLFEHIHKLPAAHCLVLEDGKLSLTPYWELSFTTTCHDDEASAVARTRALLEDAVRVRLMSEVPLGAFLSGGLDSSLVVALMSQLLPQPVKTFSIGFEEDAFNELPYARRVAQHFGTEHHELLVRPDLVSVLPQLVRAYDEPFADSSMLPTYYVSKLAHEQVSVVLTGDGGDELFAGYRHYQRERLISHIPEPMRPLLSQISMLMPDGMRGKGRLSNLQQELGLRYIQGTAAFPPDSRSTMYAPDYFAHIRDYNPYARQAGQFEAVSQLDVVTQMQYVDAHNYLIDDILVKVDRASMLNSLEARAPLLDHQLAEYVSSLQPSLRMRHGTLKYLLKKVAADIVPPEILRRKKRGFAVPIDRWFRGSLAAYARETLLSSQAQQRGIFDPGFVRKLLQAHSNTPLVNHSAAIWTLLCLELWFQVYMDTPAISHNQRSQIHIKGRGKGIGLGWVGALRLP